MNLEWLTDPYGCARVAGIRLGDGDYVFWPVDGFEVVRLKLSAAGRMLINGVAEEREDFMALLGAMEEVDDADLPPGEVAYLGDWN